MTTGKTTKPASRPFSPAGYLRDEESIAEFILAMLEDGDERMIPATLRTVADAVGMSELSRRTGLDRSNLYAALSDSGNPRLDTLATVAHAFGLKVTLQRAAKPARKRPVKHPEKKRAAPKRESPPVRARA